MADRPHPGDRPRHAVGALDLALGRTARRVTEAARATAIRPPTFNPLRLADSYPADATAFWSNSIEARQDIPRPLCKTLRTRKVINRRAAR